MMKVFQLLLPRSHIQRTFHCGIQRCYYSSKKDLSLPLAVAYNPKEVENGWYKWWEENGFFRRHDAEEKFVMILPPPNITGHLHLGHALTCAIQDALARWHQMNGKKVVWVPGCDHAGIATQVVVERHLWATEKTTRHQLGKEKFIREVMKWKDVKGMKIYDQMKRLGVSLDWDRAMYTMDEHMCETVSEAFIKLFDSGLIYRKMSLVNWCCELQSAISNIEVEHLELQGPTPLRVPGYEEPVTFGLIYDFAYRISDSDEEVVVSTTRPETMLGDTAVMVNPEDGRYKHIIGKQLIHPFRKDTIPVIADTVVDPEFGTGAVKVTPAHSTHDFEVGVRHNLKQISILDEWGKMNTSEFMGQPRFKARISVIDALSQLGLYRDCRSHPMVIPRCSRTGDIIEPFLKPQWYVSVKQMASKAVSVVQNGKLEIYPENYKNIWYEWLAKNVQDWCISRQLWWGHRIPAYRIYTDDPKKELWIAASSKEEAKRKIMEKEGLLETDIKSIDQEDDVLDTWFSSGLLPFAAFGWPNDTQELNHLYPTSLLETGHDILFFWVARMVMLGLQLTEELPFKTVLLHGLIHDAQGQKMSKSRGNVIDPMDVIDGATLKDLQGRVTDNEKGGVLAKHEAESAQKYQASSFPKGIPVCGADALRLSLCSYNLENQSVSVDINRMEQNKFLGNKIWQVMRFLMSAIADDKCCTHVQFEQRGGLHVMDRWILSHLSNLVHSSQKGFSSFNLHHVVGNFEYFWYKCLCSVYLECIKPVLKSDDEAARFAVLQTLWTTMDASLRLLSPFMPFLTEELYQRLPRLKEGNDSILQCHYPHPDEWNCWKENLLEDKVQGVLEVASAIRSLKDGYNIEGRRHKDLEGSIVTEDKDLKSFLNESTSIVQTLARIGSFSIVDPPAKPPLSSAVTTISDSTSVHLQLEGFIDPHAEAQRLNKKIIKLKKSENNILKQMSTKRYEQKAPLYIKNSFTEKLNTLRKEMEYVATLLKTIEDMKEKLD